MKKTVVLVFALAVFLFLFLCALELSSGTAKIELGKIFSFLFSGEGLSETEKVVLVQIRIPRLLAAILTGCSLSLAGAGMQSLFRNPLADPSITGVSSGAAAGAVLAISIFSASDFAAIQTGALVFALAAATCVAFIAKCGGGKISPLGILLAGIAVNAFCAALQGICVYGVRDAGLRGFVFWSLGSLEAADWSSLKLMAALSIPAWMVLFICSRSLNVMLLGDRQAFDSGVNVRFVWLAVTASSAVMTAACVAVCGTIGFIGIIIPHISRFLIGPDNVKLLPLSTLLGASLLMFADLCSRLALPTDPIPIGAITALIGAPIFAAMLGKAGKYD